MTNLVKKTDVPGKFSYSSRHESSHSQTLWSVCPVITHCSAVILPPASFGDGNDMIVVDVKYDEYALVHVVDTKREHLTVVNKLYCKSLALLGIHVFIQQHKCYLRHVFI